MTASPVARSQRARPRRRGRPDQGERPAITNDGRNRGLFRVEEAAEWLGLSRTKAYELVYRGALQSVTIGRSRRVPLAALEAFVDRLLENGGVL